MKGFGIFVSTLLAIAAGAAVVLGVLNYLKNKGCLGNEIDLYDDEDIWDCDCDDCCEEKEEVKEEE